MATKKTKSSGRFGSRYGRKIRNKVSIIEAKQRKKQKCPYCSKLAVKRTSAGVFLCRSCNVKFTGGAYTI